jgi:uncharacterized protein (TIGR02996 family)
METESGALEAAVRASPTDDAPRLAYADWLDEHGRPDRAAFIRVQCELAGGPSDELDLLQRQLWSKLDRREFGDELVSVAQWWLGATLQEAIPVPPRRRVGAVRNGWPAFMVGRGFLTAVVAPGDQWVTIGDQVLARHPITAVGLVNLPTVEGLGRDHRRGNSRGRGADYVLAFRDVSPLAFVRVPTHPPADLDELARRLLAAQFPTVRDWRYLPDGGL